MRKFWFFAQFPPPRFMDLIFLSESVNQHNYLEILKVWFWPKHLRTDSYKIYYFQQDGATPHTANSVQNWLSSKFGDKFVDKTLTFNWVSYSHTLV